MRVVPGLLQENRIILFLNNIPRFTRLAITFGSVGGLIICWVLFLYVPIMMRSRECKKQIVDDSRQVVLLEQSIARLSKFQKNNDVIKQNWKDLFDSSFDITQKIIDCSKKLHIRCTTLKPLGTKRNKFFETMSYDIGLDGKFHDVFALLQQMDELSFVTKIKRCMFSREAENKIAVKFCLHAIKVVEDAS